MAGSQSWQYTAWLIGGILLVCFNSEVRSATPQSTVTNTSTTANATTAMATTAMTTPAIGTTAMTTPAIGTTAMTTPAIATTAMTTPAIATTAMATTAMATTAKTTKPTTANTAKPTTAKTTKPTTAKATAPAKGPNVTVTTVNSTVLNVTWVKLGDEDSNGDITKYEICYKLGSMISDSNCTTNETVIGVNNRMVYLTGLKPATTYAVAARAFNDIGPGPLGLNKTARTNEDVPSKGPKITDTTVTSTEMMVTWDELSPDDANGMVIQYQICYKATKKLPVTDCNLNKTVNATDNTMVVLDELNEATTYVVAVRAATAEGFGKFGTTVSNTTLDDVPSKGPNITGITDVTSTEMRVTWAMLSPDDANGEIIRYQVCYKDTENLHIIACNSSKMVNANDNTTVVLIRLNEATTYVVAVKAETSVGFGKLGTPVRNSTLEDKPVAGPMITNITAVNSTSLKVVWNKLSLNDSNGEIVNYTVCYKVHDTTSFGDICTAKRKVVLRVNSTETILTDLMKATSYDVAIQAATAVGFGPFGNLITRKTLEAAPAKGAFVTKVGPVSSTVLEITWRKLQPNDTNGNITRYMVCYDSQSSVEGCTRSKVVYGANNTTFNLTALNEDTTYYVAVQAGTSAGFSKIRNTLNSTTLEAVPAEGPTIKNVVPKSSTSLTVTWNELSHDDANGRIRQYIVCYKETENPKDICSSSENVGNETSTILAGLNKYTSYDVAIKAATLIGFGKTGAIVTNETKEDRPGRPKDLNIKEVDFTKISLRWSEPLKPNGKIVNYKVCWKKSSCEMKEKPAVMAFVIINLQPGTVYNISVSAFTSIGEGPAVSERVTTVKSKIGEVELTRSSSVGVSDGTTQIGFKLPKTDVKEAVQISSFQVIVKRWISNHNKDDLRVTPESELTNFADSENGKKAYISLSMTGYTRDMEIIVGNDLQTAARRKRRNTQYRNAPLIEDTQYAIFVRVFYRDSTSVSNSGILIASTSKKETESNATIIAVVVVVIVLFILVAVFGLLLLRRRVKSRSHYNGIELETPAKPVVRYPIPVDEFRAHCGRLGQNADLGYQEEYESIRPQGQVSSELAKRPENLDKNRYNNIHAYDDSRVVLSQIDGEEGSDYINANHIDGFERKNMFIAAQGTLKHTIVDFWRMLWEQNVSSIVMLANPIEKGREKLAVYWPQDRAVKHGPFMIKLDGEVELADYVIRKMTVTKDDVKETRQLTQFHYTVWPDHGVPPYTTSLQAFLTRIRKFVKDISNPVVVHCSAGVGRTGTFIGIFAMLDMIEATKTVDIFNFVCQMRTQRTHMVQVESQYVFLHKAVLEAIECGDTEINAPDLRVKMNHFNRADPENADQTNMDKQFKVLEKYTFIKKNTDEAKKPFNNEKNRNKDILPYEDTRVSLLKSPGVDGSDYINASFIDSYQVRGMYIATQFPLENTLNDFWRMIWEKKSNCIVMLASIDEQPGTFKKYWTGKNDALLCGNLLVSLENEEDNDEFVTRNFKLKKSDGGETREIWHFNFLTWTEDEVPNTTAGIRQMIGKIQEVQRQGGNNPIIAHCSDGGGRTGAFCALVTSLERVKQDQSFNLFQTIMLQRIQRPRMVASVQQYKFCFRAILDFLDSFDQYANFQDLRQ